MTDQKQVLALSLYAGEIILKNGAETYRVEDTITRLCESRGFSSAETFVVPTAIFVSIDKGNTGEETHSYIKRIHSRNINLDKISKVSEFSRDFVNTDMSINEGIQLLEKIDNSPGYSNLVKILFGGIASGFFALLFQSNPWEALCAFLTGSIVTGILICLSNRKMPFFLANILGGGTLALFAVLLSSLTPMIRTDKIIIGAIMVMVPGVAITNAVRDTILGDLISGLARAGEAFMIAISIAFGVGTILAIWSLIMGGTLI